MSHPADRAAAVLLAQAPLGAEAVRALVRLHPSVVRPLARNPRLGGDAWRVLYRSGVDEDTATALVDRPLTPEQVHLALVTRRERRDRPVERLLRHGQCPVPVSVAEELLRTGAPEVRAALAVAVWIPVAVRAAAAASVPPELLRPVEPAALARLNGEFRGRVVLTAEERAQAAATPIAGLSLQPWRVQRAAADLAAEACGQDAAAWDVLLRLVRGFRGPLGALLAVAPAIAA